MKILDFVYSSSGFVYMDVPARFFRKYGLAFEKVVA